MAGEDRKHEPLGSLNEFDDLSEVTVRITMPRSAPTAQQAIPTLRVVAGRDMLHFVTFGDNEKVTIGRDESCGLRLTDITVSKRHARVQASPTGAITVLDLGSTNGTAVNGRQINEAPLRPGDHLEVGEVSLRLVMLSEEELGHLKRVLKRLEAANRDPLTGLLTRSYLEEQLPELVRRCDNAPVPISAAFLDADRFKAINDTFGHQVGDEVLSGIARLLMLCVRDADPCVRYGGEEMVVFLPGSSETGAIDVADRIRRTIAGHDWERTASGLQVTSSFGVAQRHPDESIKAWLNRADRATYAAKNAGRNRVERASTIVD